MAEDDCFGSGGGYELCVGLEGVALGDEGLEEVGVCGEGEVSHGAKVNKVSSRMGRNCYCYIDFSTKI